MKQATQPDSGMAEILKLSDWELKITGINVKDTNRKGGQYARTDG